ncbi:MAG: ribbon-helix-helix protein, CopG family, partial [Candidatus Hydrothermarchaeaceae archaeon]
MVTPTRVTIALDKETAELFERLKQEENASKSGLMRRALKFYSEYKDILTKGDKKIETYMEMLSDGEHIIFDVDHWLLFLKHLETS